jgi:hypothetical protein
LQGMLWVLADWHSMLWLARKLPFDSIGRGQSPL